jgi:hypothetical protein
MRQRAFSASFILGEATCCDNRIWQCSRMQTKIVLNYAVIPSFVVEIRELIYLVEPEIKVFVS